MQDIFLTETAEFADVILPASSYFEKEGTFTNTDRRVQLGAEILQLPGAPQTAGQARAYPHMALSDRRLVEHRVEAGDFLDVDRRNFEDFGHFGNHVCLEPSSTFLLNEMQGCQQDGSFFRIFG